ncbi:MAG: ABC transporter permease, partial [Turicibacter sp.]
MSLINIVQGALINIKANKIRVFLTMIGIIIGISSVVVILAIGDGVKAEFAKTTSDISGNKIEVSFYQNNYDEDISTLKPITPEDITNLSEIEGVEKVEINNDYYSMNNEMDAVYGEGKVFGKSSSIYALPYDQSGYQSVLAGRFFENSDTLNDVIVITYQTALNLFDSPEDAIGVSLDIDSNMFEIIGVLEKPMSIFDYSNDFVQQASLDRLSAALPPVIEGEATPRNIYIFIEPGQDYDEVIGTVIKELEQAHEGINGTYEAWNPGDMVESFNSMISSITAFVALITAISLLVGGIGVMNIMYVSVTERKREIGIRRAIGATPTSIMLQFLFEAMFVTLIGGLIGIALGFLLAQLVGLFMPFTPILSLSSFVGASATSIIVGIVFGIIPARKAAKLDPIKAI